MIDELHDQQTDLTSLFKSDENIEETSEGGAVEEGEGNFVDVPS